jgi:hypothetical protein
MSGRFRRNPQFFYKYDDLTDNDVPDWANSADWIYKPDCDSAVSNRLPFLPLAGAPMNKIKNHAKLLAEALPPLSGAAGFSQVVSIVGTNRCFDLNNAPFKDTSLWPATRPGKSDAQQATKRWLHGDYKDPSYLLTHTFYDKITELTN